MNADTKFQHRSVRLATPNDSYRLCSIYSYYVERTTASFEYTAPGVDEFERRIRAFSEKCPYLVFCEDGEILGYAYAHPAFERAAYAWCAETTIYLDRHAKGRGIGRVLYGALIDYLAIQGYKIAYAVVVAENAESCVFHQKNGFHSVAVFPKTGYKFGRWLDVIWYERILGVFQESAVPPLSFNELPPDVIKRVCEEANASLRS